MPKSPLADLVIAPPALPLTGADAVSFLRDAETQVLDKYHETIPLWSLNPNRALFATLVAMDSFAPVLSVSMARADSVGLWQWVSYYEEGWTVALRWLFPRLANDGFAFVATDDDVDLAAEFLQHSSDYGQLEVMHVSFGKGIFQVSASKSPHVIRFTREASLPGVNAAHHFSDLIAPRRALANSGETDNLLREMDAKLESISPHLAQGRVQYDCIVANLNKDVIAACAGLVPPEIVDLEPSESMGPFTYSDFARYWDVLRAWSSVAVRLYLKLFQRRHPQNECMPTQVVPANEFISEMVRLTGLSNEVVVAISNFLTYDNRTKRPDVFLQPLLRLGGMIVWSPLLVTLSRQPRNALKLLCRTKNTQDLGATLNGTRERSLLLRFGLFLQQNAGYAYKLNVPLSHGELATELDLLAYRVKAPDEVLLVQGKTPIAAAEQNEIDAVTQDVIEGAVQCRTAEQILRAMPLEEKRKLYKFVKWELVTSYHSIVITPDSEPHGKYDANEIPAISLAAFESRVRPNRLRSPSIICETCKERRWQEKHASDVEAYTTIAIGDVTYQLPYILDPHELVKRGISTEGI